MIVKLYKLGRSGRLAIMLPKEAVFEVGEYNIEIGSKVAVIAPQEPTEASNEVVEAVNQNNGDTQTENSF